MANWQLTLGLQNLRNQINAWAPDRDHTSDGTIGDTAHQAGISGHNPDDVPDSHAEWNGDPDNIPEVRAIDVDTDLRNGATAQQLVDHIVGLRPSSVLRYVIYNRRIWEAGNGWNSRPYSGSSPHTEHIHFSGAYSQASDNDTSFDYRLEDIPVALTTADKQWISAQIASIAEQVWAERIGNPTYPSRTAKQALNDLSTLRDNEVDPNVGMKGVAAGTALDRIVKAADAILKPAGAK